MQEQNLMLTLDQFNEYTTLCHYGDTIGFLESFLHDTPIGDAKFYIEWALNPSKDYQVTGQLACLYKKHNTIFVGSLFAEPEDKGPFFEISINEFINLLVKWEELLRIKPNSITIYQTINGLIMEAE